MKRNEIYVLASLILILSVILMTTFASYAFFEYYQEGSVSNNIMTGYLDAELENDGGINLSGAFPVSDETGHSSDPYKFTLKNTTDRDLDYVVTIVDDIVAIENDKCSNNLLKHSLIHVQLIEVGNGVVAEELLSEIESNIFSGTISKDNPKEYELRLWIDKDADNSIMGNHYHGKISIKLNQHVSNN